MMLSRRIKSSGYNTYSHRVHFSEATSSQKKDKKRKKKEEVVGSRREQKNPVIKEVEVAPHEACER